MKHIIGGKPALPAAEVKTLRVDEDDSGQRLDNYLVRHLKGVPKTHIYRIIRSGEVRVNKGRVAVNRRVEAGDLVRLPPVRSSLRALVKAQVMADTAAAGLAEDVDLADHERTAPPREFPVLLEDESFLAVDKPAGVAVHGGSGVSFGVIEQLRMVRPQARFLELVHRLDRETSGILLVAKKRSALKNMQNQFRERETGKTYLALVAGQWPARLKVLDGALHKYLLPDGERRVKVVAKDHPDAMQSLTLVKVARPLGAFTLLEVTIKTGRTHQIRVHLAAAGMPIAGDEKYGDFQLNKSMQRAGAVPALRRMFLHAWRLQFTHPVTGKRVELQSNLPSDLQQFIDHVAQDRS